MIEFLEPWQSMSTVDHPFHTAVLRQIEREVGVHHVLYQVPMHLIAQGNGDDLLFALDDGSGRVAVVHLLWSLHRPTIGPSTTLYPSLMAWVEAVMLPEHHDWMIDP